MIYGIHMEIRKRAVRNSYSPSLNLGSSLIPRLNFTFWLPSELLVHGIVSQILIFVLMPA